MDTREKDEHQYLNFFDPGEQVIGGFLAPAKSAGARNYKIGVN
jgi:hypothetical protein